MLIAKAAQIPDETALVFEGEQVTYGQLARRVEGLARHLIGRGAGPEVVVALGLPRTVDMVVALVRRAAVNRTVLMVEHNLSVVSRLCDRITVLARGAVLAEGDYDSVSANPQVREAYLGSEAAVVEAQP